MRQPLSSLLAVVAILALVPATAGAQALAIYDTFDGTTIDPVKWRGAESASSLAIVSSDAARGIVNNQLKLALTTSGVHGSGTGLAGEARNRVLLNHGALIDGDPQITVMRTTVTVKRAVAENCAAADLATTTSAGLFGFFFNDGSGSVLPNDFTGDVLAVLDMRRDSRAGRTINAAVARCTTASCSSADILSSGVFAKTWATNEVVTLTIRWQPGLNRFAFQATSDAGTESQMLAYALSDGNPSKAFLKDLRVNNAVPHCAAGPVKALIDARFDDMRINETAGDALGG
jgi:hypothetical protein